MPGHPQQSEIEKLRAFELRMQTEGAAGFASGLAPWNDWQETDTGSKKRRSWGCDREQNTEDSGQTPCEKLLSTVAMLAVATLAVGIGGVYLSAQQAQPVIMSTDQPDTTDAMLAQAMPSTAPSTGMVRRDDGTSAAMVTGQDSTDMPAAADPTGHERQASALSDAEAVELITRLAPPGTPLEQPDTPQVPAGYTPGQVLAVPVASPEFPAADISTALPAPAAGKPVAAAPVQLATAASPLAGAAQQPGTATPAAQASPQPTMAPPTAQALPAGKWVVNISSYTYESMARRKLEEFRKQGVSAEIFPVTIKGRPMFRIRATGYETRQEANTWVSLLEERLDLDGAWVSKR